MNSILFDACTLISLQRAGVLIPILTGLKAHSICYAGEFVVEECCDEIPCFLTPIIHAQLITVVTNLITTAEFMDALMKYKLGDGETECMLISLKTGHTICSDDRKARAMFSQAGCLHSTGTIGLLKHVINLGILPRAAADAAYIKMINTGSFLPKHTPALLD